MLTAPRIGLIKRYSFFSYELSWALGVMLHEICSSGRQLTLSNLEPLTISPELPFWAYTIVLALCWYDIRDHPPINAPDTDRPNDRGKFSADWMA